MLRFSLALIAAFLVFAPWAVAQDVVEEAAEAVEEVDIVRERIGETKPARLGIYVPKHMPAQEVASLVEQLMGKDISAIPEPLGNRVLIRGSEASLKEAKAVLDILDQPPKMIAFDVMFADLPAAPNGEKSAPGATSDDDWLARLKDENSKAKGNIQKLRLTATENQKSMAQFGEETAIVTGVQADPRFGRGARSSVTQRKQMGTLMQCTARVLETGSVVVEFQIERTRMAPPEDAAVLDESDDAGVVRSPGVLTTTCQTTLHLKPGQPRVISGLKNQGPNRGTYSVIVITAEVIDSK